MDQVEHLHGIHAEIRGFLIEQDQISFASEMELLTPKIIVLASASGAEALIVQLLVDYFTSSSPGVPIVPEFLKARGLHRQFHSLFDWDAANVNKFWALFGDDFKSYAKAAVDEDDELRDSIAAFLEIGRLRNAIVHQNFAEFQLGKTADEVQVLHQRSRAFVARLPDILGGFTPQQ